MRTRTMSDSHFLLEYNLRGKAKPFANGKGLVGTPVGKEKRFKRGAFEIA